MLLDDELYSDLDEDRESATHQLYLLENQEKIEDQSDEYSITFADQKNMILMVKECQEVESRILRIPTASNSYELLHDQVEFRDDEFNEVTSASATQACSKILIKTSLGESVQENNDGFQTPTKFHGNGLPSNGLKCPPAPRKPKAKPLGKRKRACRNLQVEFVNEVELALELLMTGGYAKVKKARTQVGRG